MRFEQERSAWAPGYRPTLDVIVEHDGAPVRLFVESKCIEFLRKCATDFSATFPKKASEHLCVIGADESLRVAARLGADAGAPWRQTLNRAWISPLSSRMTITLSSRSPA